MYGSEVARVMARDFPQGFDEVDAAEAFGRWVLGAGEGHLVEMTEHDRRRIFNLGYFTWVEQQGLPVGDFSARRDQSFWSGLRAKLSRWDEMIKEFNSRSGVPVP